MKHKFFKMATAICLLCLVFAFLAGCTSTEADPATTNTPADDTQETQDTATHIVVDSYGREVELPNEIESVVLTSSYPVYLSSVSYTHLDVYKRQLIWSTYEQKLKGYPYMRLWTKKY